MGWLDAHEKYALGSEQVLLQTHLLKVNCSQHP